MRRLLAEPDLVRQMGERARQRIRRVYQWDDVVAGYEHILDRAVTGGYRALRQPDVAYAAAALVDSTQEGRPGA